MSGGPLPMYAVGRVRQETGSGPDARRSACYDSGDTAMYPFRSPGVAVTSVVALCAALAGGARPQAPQPVEPKPGAQAPATRQPAPIFRSTIDLVRVDVSVTGRDDQALADLRIGEFAVSEDGVPQKIEALEFVRLDGTRTSDREESLDIRSPEHAALEAARDDVRLFVIFWDDYHVDWEPTVTLPLRRALAALVQQFGPNDLVAIMDPLTPIDALAFTRTRRALLDRIDKIEGRRGRMFPVRSAAEENQLREPNAAELRAGVSLSALDALVTHLGGLREGRKSVLFVSQGPPLGRVGSSNEDRLRDIVQSANRSNVTIHVYDPRPLGAAPFGGAEVLARLGSETGGRAILGSNDPGPRLTQVIADASAYYLLGYVPSRPPNDGKFHKIEVRVTRRGARVLARRGYWAPTAKEATPVAAAAPLAPGLSEALATLARPRGGHLVDTWVGASAGLPGRSRLAVTWERSRADGADTPARILVAPLANDRRTALADAVAIGPSAEGTIDLAEAAAVVLRFTAEAEDGTALDRWDQATTVPRFTGAPLALGTPRVLRGRSALEVRAIERGDDPSPAAARIFSRTDRIIVVIPCYGEPCGRDASAALLNAQGQPLVDLPAPAFANGALRLALPVGSLAPGTYALRVTAGSGVHAEQHVAFHLVR